MDDKDKLETWGILKEFGFHWDLEEDGTGRKEPSNEYSGLYYDFGNLKLGASLQFYLGPVVLFTWTWLKPPPMSHLFKMDFVLPRQMESRELCAALIAYYLDNRAATGGRKFFIPAKRAPWWLRMGQDNQHVLPWEQRKEAYEARPRCTVEKAWAKPVLKILTEYLEDVNDDTRIIFSFSYSEMTIQFRDTLYAMWGNGTGSKTRYTIAAGNLKRRPPQRLRGSDVEFSIWESSLYINNYCYAGVVEITDEENRGEVPLKPTYIFP